MIFCPTHRINAEFACPECTSHFHSCARCGQVVITRADPPICETCRKVEREPQGEAVRLFTPAPAQIAGQLAL